MPHSDQSSRPVFVSDASAGERLLTPAACAEAGTFGRFSLCPTTDTSGAPTSSCLSGRCRSCDICFLNPFPPAELGAEYFAQSYAAPAKSLYYDDEFKSA